MKSPSNLKKYTRDRSDKMIVYLAIVVAFCAIYPIIPRKHIKWLFLALVLALSVMAFYMKPYETDDISNYFNQVSML